MTTNQTLSNPDGANLPPLAGLQNFFARRPYVSATLLTLSFMLIGAVVGILAKTFLPGVQPDFIALCVMSVLIAGLLTGLRWWRAAGFNRPGEWRDLHLLWLPAIVALVLPLLGGVRPTESGTLLFLSVAYALTGFMEEAFSRGIVLRVLRPTGVVRAVLLSGVLFGLLHAGNLLYRSPAVVLPQMVGAACFGIAYAALRVRTNTLWFLIPLHGLSDLVLHMTVFPVNPLDVVRDLLLLGYGLYLIRKGQALEGPSMPNILPLSKGESFHA